MDVEEKIRNIENLCLMESSEDVLNFWKHIFELVRKYADVVFERNNLNKLRRILVDNLLTYGSNDFTTVKRVIDTCALGMGWRCICKKHRGLIFWGILSPSNELHRMHKRCTFTELKILDLAIRRIDVKLVTVLVKYGLFQIPSRNGLIFHDISEAESTLKEFCDTTYLFGLNLGVDMEMCSHVAKRFVNELRETKYKFRRIQLILRVLDAITRKRINCETDDCVKCIKLFIETIPDPFLTKTEVNLFLRYLFSYEKTHDAADSLTEDYAELFPVEALEPLQPRSLVHLCRCSFRQTISKTGKLLPKVVNDLHLPSSLKSYILIE